VLSVLSVFCVIRGRQLFGLPIPEMSGFIVAPISSVHGQLPVFYTVVARCSLRLPVWQSMQVCRYFISH